MSMTDDLNEYMPEVVQKTVQFAYDILQHCDNRGDMYLVALGLVNAVISTQLEANLTDEKERKAVMQIVEFLESNFEVTSVPLTQLDKPRGELN